MRLPEKAIEPGLVFIAIEVIISYFDLMYEVCIGEKEHYRFFVFVIFFPCVNGKSDHDKVFVIE